MGLINGIQCDLCGRRDLWEWTCGKLYIERWARADGWKIGKQCRRESCTRHDFDVSQFALKHKCVNCGCEESIEYIQGYRDGLKHAALEMEGKTDGA